MNRSTLTTTRAGPAKARASAPPWIGVAATSQGSPAESALRTSGETGGGRSLPGRCGGAQRAGRAKLHRVKQAFPASNQPLAGPGDGGVGGGSRRDGGRRAGDCPRRAPHQEQNDASGLLPRPQLGQVPGGRATGSGGTASGARCGMGAFSIQLTQCNQPPMRTTTPRATEIQRKVPP